MTSFFSILGKTLSMLIRIYLIAMTLCIIIDLALPCYSSMIHAHFNSISDPFGLFLQCKRFSSDQLFKWRILGITETQFYIAVLNDLISFVAIAFSVF